MIEQLMVKDYILFDRASIDFKEDMSVITGETGAGKSLLIDAITYLSGGRMSNSIVRQGKEKSILQMVISTQNKKVLDELEDNGFEIDDGQIIIQRTMSAQGKSSVRINQQVTTLAFVRKIVSQLIDVHSQMDTIQLMDPEIQLELLDQYVNDPSLLEQVKEAYKTYHQAEKAYKKAKNETYSDDELDYLTNALNEIQDAHIQEQELETLSEKIKELSKSQQNLDDLGEATYLLSKENGILDSLYTAYKILNKNGSFSEQSESLKNDYYHLLEVNEVLKEQRETIFHEGSDLDALQEREYFIKKMYRKFGGSYAAMMEKSHSFETKIDAILHRQDLLDKLSDQLDQAQKNYDRLANELSQKRRSVFDDLSKQIESHCKDLMLENARFQIDRKEKNRSADGIDEIEFLVSMNPGQPFSPLKQSASGGELSRLMLALKTVFQAKEGIDTIIFDEIDTGVSGKVALAMGQKMHSLSKTHQVLCITHLSSVAVWADSHYLVKKEQKEDSTTTSIEPLNEQQRYEELATMASGSAGESAIESMKELRKKVLHG